jgi:hypothetical protein
VGGLVMLHQRLHTGPPSRLVNSQGAHNVELHACPQMLSTNQHSTQVSGECRVFLAQGADAALHIDTLQAREL